MPKAVASLKVPSDIGLAVQQARLGMGKTQTELARELRLPQSTISEIESGKSTIYLRTLFEIMRATGVELSATWPDGDADAPRG